MPFNMQGWEWVILIVLALLIFGGTRLAGAGTNAGRALREFKDETRQIKADDEKAKREQAEKDALTKGTPAAPVVDEIVEAEVVEQPEKRDQV